MASGAGSIMKISSVSGDGFHVKMEAEDNDEAKFLHKFFGEDCKEIMKKFPLKDKEWKP